MHDVVWAGRRFVICGLCGDSQHLFTIDDVIFLNRNTVKGSKINDS